MARPRPLVPAVAPLHLARVEPCVAQVEDRPLAARAEPGVKGLRLLDLREVLAVVQGLVRERGAVRVHRVDRDDADRGRDQNLAVERRLAHVEVLEQRLVVLHRDHDLRELAVAASLLVLGALAHNADHDLLGRRLDVVRAGVRRGAEFAQRWHREARNELELARERKLVRQQHRVLGRGRVLGDEVHAGVSGELRDVEVPTVSVGVDAEDVRAIAGRAHRPDLPELELLVARGRERLGGEVLVPNRFCFCDHRSLLCRLSSRS